MINNSTTYRESLVKHRRNLHKIPEIGRELPETREYLISVLQELGCTMTFLCDTGICAYFDKGQQETIGFRADMDALPLEEVNKCEYRSTHQGKMHACGHDGHMSMVLTLGEYVNNTDELKYNVLLIFQPAEETLGGAEEICQSGILDKYNVTKIYGFHMWPFLEAGKISTRPNAFMPKSAEINIDIIGKAAHGTSPFKGNDALYIAADYIRKVYEKHAEVPGAVPRFPEGIGNLPRAEETEPEEKTLIHIGKMDSGYARNVVSDHTHLLGTVRAYNEDNFCMVINLLKDTLKEIEEEYRCNTEFSNSDGYPPVVNDPKLYAEIKPLLESLPGGYEEMELPLMISEDFSFFGLYRPAVFFVLGTGTGIPLHSTNFDFNESVLFEGFRLYTGLLEI